MRWQCPLLGLIAIASMATAAVPLDVPFIPQVPPPDSSVVPVATAWKHTRNCGQTSVLMVMSFYSVHKPVSQDIARIDDYLSSVFADPVNNYYGSYTGGTKTNRLVSIATGFGVTQAGQGFGAYPDTHAYSGWTLQQLQAELSAGHPVIVGVWTDMSIRVNKAGKATVPHWMVLTGITDIVYVNDPGHTYGKNNQYTLTDFEAAWSDQGSTVVVVHPAIPQPGQTSTWTQQFPASHPAARGFSSMAYDELRQNIVLFGGQSIPQFPADLNETWIWDGSNWTQRSPSSAPPPRMMTAMAYDRTHGQIVLFGGWNFSLGQIYSDTWFWDGTKWLQEHPVSVPPARAGASLTYDATRSLVVLFGGMGVGHVLNDTWVWDGSNWTQKFPNTSPPLRWNHVTSFDPSRQQMVLYGGRPTSSGPVDVMNDTWVWDGTNWTQRLPVTTSPARDSAAMAWDPAMASVLLFGGTNDIGTAFSDTWSWDGSNWSLLTPPNSPSMRFGHAMAFGANYQKVVLFGGNCCGADDDTWVWGPPGQ